MPLEIVDHDILFFRQYTDRQARIRDAIGEESNAEFLSLGPHDRSRRRIIIVRVPDDARMAAGKLMKVPFLAFADETIADDDETLLPIVHHLMMDAAKRYNIRPSRR